MRYDRKRRGVSEIVGVLLMLAIVVSLGVLLFTFTTGGLNSLSGSYSADMSEKASATAEKFTVEQVAFTFPGSLSTDGTSTNEVPGASASIATTLTTANSNDLIMAYVSAENSGGTSPPAVSGISGGGLTWTHRVTAPAESYTDNYVAITLTNSQTTATPTSFQQEVTWDPATFAAYEASDLGNVRFCADDVCATPLYAWLESCTASCGTSATSAIAWVNLGTHTIAANGGTLTIYLVFKPTTTEFDGVYWGEAPTLSPTYAEFDNGANVFAGYFNGDTSTADFSVYTGLTVSQAAIAAANGPGGVAINAIEVTGTTGAHKAAFIFNQAMSNVALITESNYATEEVNDATGINGFMSSPTATSATINGIGVGTGDGGSYFYEGTDAAGTVTIPQNGSPGGNPVTAGDWYYGEVTYTGTASTSWSAYNSPTLYNPTAGCGTCSATEAATPPITTATNLYLGSMDGSSLVLIYYNWMRARAYPPAGVMPTVGVGSAASTATATMDLEEWYATASSPLSAASITATLSTSDTGATWIAVFGISGANTVSPFDPNTSIPDTSSGATPSTTVSTSDANDVMLYACAAGTGSMAAGYTSIFSLTYAPPQNEYVGYQAVSGTETALATSCGTNSYGAMITDAVVSSGGADIYVRNTGSIPTTLVSVYVNDLTANSVVASSTISLTIDVGTYGEITHNSVAFVPSHGHEYSFTVTSSLGNSAIYEEEAD